MKGIILSGGNGSRLFPTTSVISKQLLPIYDKPMIYYPLSTLIHAGVNSVLIITTPSQIENYRALLKNGKQFGIEISYKVQESPGGVAQGVSLAEDFTGEDNFWFILGDNLFHGPDFGRKLKGKFADKLGAIAFGYRVINPEDYGVVDFNADGTISRIIEKPIKFISSWAIPGLYRFDKKAFDYIKEISPSKR